MEDNVSNPAWRIPTSLLRLSARNAAEAVICASLPSKIFSDNWYKRVGDDYDKSSIHDSYKCLKVALTHQDDRRFAKEKQHLISTLSDLRQWWDGPEGIVSLPVILQKEVIYYVIDTLESETEFVEGDDEQQAGIYCLFRWLRMLIFSGQTKGKLVTLINLDGVSCTAFSCLLDALAPFPCLQWLDFGRCSFMDPVPLITILRNSPNIRSLRLDNNAQKLFKYVEIFCPNLEILSIHDPGYSDHLYELFFNGISKGTVWKIIRCNGRIKLTFPHLKIIQHSWSSGELTTSLKMFLLVLLHYYPQLESLTYVGDDGFNTKAFSPDWDDVSVGIPKSPCKLSSVLVSTILSTVRGQAFDTSVLDKVAQFCPEADHLTLEENISLGYDFDMDYLSLSKGSLKKFTRAMKFTSLRLSMGDKALKRYAPNVYAIAENITNLDYDVGEEGEPLLFEIINLCTNLECIKVEVNEAINLSLTTKENPLNVLPKLSIVSMSGLGNYTEVSSLLKCVSKAAPNIQNLYINLQELRDLTRFCSIVSGGLLNKVENWTLRHLVQYPANFSDVRDCIEKVVPALPFLTKLRLCLTVPTTMDIVDPDEEFDVEYYKSIYRNTALLIVNGLNN
ncbi:unnamed protein product [Meganyctiphanes norvegica]|uniref:Uncharacterized protein n=1 Tax=Meganyctiphanes norvegica TaxID=48144 RepID=A0AAV2QN29_MEGNR